MYPSGDRAVVTARSPLNMAQSLCGCMGARTGLLLACFAHSLIVFSSPLMHYRDLLTSDKR